MRKKPFLWSLTAMAALLTASCSDDLPGQGGATTGGGDGEEVEVTFTISTEDAALLHTRAVKDDPTTDNADHGPGQYQSTIGKGLKVDALIYAVYEDEKDDNNNYILLGQYGKGFIGIEADGTATSGTKPFGDQELYFLGKDHNGQTIVNVGGLFSQGGAYTLTLRLMRNKVYHLAFWAQSSKTAAFDTHDLAQVTVNYDNAKNNDELRDAFCKVESFSVSASATPRKIVLTRPMAQINVGTSGADYKHYATGENVFPNRWITYSKIAIKGVSNTINVVKDEIGEVMKNADDTDKEVIFDWNPIAAYYASGIPTGDEDKRVGDDKENSAKEEFLLVDLNYDGKVAGYKTEYPTTDVTKDEEGKITAYEYLTETFKYLSMCYVLVPAAKTETQPDGSHYTSTVLSSVQVYFAEKVEKTPEAGSGAGEEGDAGEEDGAGETPTPEVIPDEEHAYRYISLTNVPAQRNWRTNILGGLHDTDDPDDPSSVFKLTTVLVERDPLFDGEYNTEGDYYEETVPPTWTQNGFPDND